MLRSCQPDPRVPFVDKSAIATTRFPPTKLRSELLCRCVEIPATIDDFGMEFAYSSPSARFTLRSNDGSFSNELSKNRSARNRRPYDRIRFPHSAGRNHPRRTTRRCRLHQTIHHYRFRLAIYLGRRLQRVHLFIPAEQLIWEGTTEENVITFATFKPC